MQQRPETFRQTRLCWLDVRDSGDATPAILEDAVHQRVDGILSASSEELALLPPTVRRILFIDEAEGQALKALGPEMVDAIVTPYTDALPAWVEAVPSGVELGTFVHVTDADSLAAACAAVCRFVWVLLEFEDPTKIPLEIVLAAGNDAKGRIITIIRSVDEAEVVFGVLERGSDGVLLTPSRVGDAALLRQATAETSPSLDLAVLSVRGVNRVGMGDRVCVDTCTYFRPDEGILVGSTSKGFVLTCSETHPLPYMPIRPFRSNAGAVHSYTLVNSERTNYLTELKAGTKVLAVDATGRTRQATVGRTKIESRPLLSIDLQSSEGRPVNIIVQDDWHVRLLGPGGTVRNVTELQPGDQVLGFLPTADRHVGYAINEFCIEQ